MIAMRRTERFGDDFVNHAELQQIVGSELQSVGCFLSILDVFPENAGTAFGADHRIIRVLKHGDVIANANPDGPPVTAEPCTTLPMQCQQAMEAVGHLDQLPKPAASASFESVRRRERAGPLLVAASMSARSSSIANAESPTH